MLRSDTLNPMNIFRKQSTNLTNSTCDQFRNYKVDQSAHFSMIKKNNE